MTGEHVIYYDDLEELGAAICPFCENDQFYVDIIGTVPYEKIVSRTCENCYSMFPLKRAIRLLTTANKEFV